MQKDHHNVSGRRHWPTNVELGIIPPDPALHVFGPADSTDLHACYESGFSFRIEINGDAIVPSGQRDVDGIGVT